MAEYDESEYFTDSQEEIAEREAKEALRRMVRTEIRRVQTGAADADIAEDIAREEEEKRANEAKSQKTPRWFALMANFMTGNILLAEEAKRIYNILTLLGAIFFTSIITIFWSLQQDLRYSALEKEVSLLKERAIRTSEACNAQTSHTAILQQLEMRGIDIGDSDEVPTTLK